MTVELSDAFGTDKEEIDWLLLEVLNYDVKNYYLHSNEIGDELGKVVEINAIEKVSD